MRRKFLSVVLCVCMMLTMAPFAFAAEKGDTSTESTQEQSNSSGSGSGSPTTSVTLPSGNSGNLTISTDNAVLDGSVDGSSNLTYTNGIITVNADNVTIKNLVFGDNAKLVVNTTGKFTLTGCTFAPTQVYNKATDTPVRTAVTLNVGEAVVTNNTFNGVASGYYNAIEFGIGASNNDLSKATITGNTFNSAIQNNYFNFYNMTEGATIDIESNHFLLANKGSNAIRISNFRNVSGVAFNVNNNEYTYENASDDSIYEGFILLQDYSEGDTVQDFSGITINTTNLTSPDSAKQLFYVYDDQDGIITTNQPVIKGDSSIAKFCSARIGDTYYASLAKAVAASTSGQLVTLLANINGPTIIQADKNIVLDLNGKTMSNISTAIVNNGGLTIRDSSSNKSGKIISTKGAGISAGNLSTNATTTIEYANIESVEGAFITSYATGATFTINDGVFTASDNAVILCNGSNTNPKNNNAPRETANTIIINGGTFNGSIKTAGYVACGIYAPWKDNITVNGGTFNITGGAGIVARAGTVTVNSGEFNTTGNATGKVGDSRVVVPCSALVFDSVAKYPALTDASKIVVKNGKFASDINTISVVKPTDTQDNNQRVEVSGGYFTTDPSAYCVTDKTGIASDLSGYAYMVGTEVISANPATVDSAIVKAGVSESVPQDKVNDVQSAANSMTAGASATGSDLEAVVKSKSDTNTITGNHAVTNNAVTNYNNTLSNENKLTADNVAIVYQSYIDVKVCDIEKASDSTTTNNNLSELTVELTPMYRVVATKQDNVNVGTALITEGEGQNAVVIQEGTKLNNVPAKNYEVKLALPSNLDTAGGKLSIKHTKNNGSIEYYTGTVTTHENNNKFVTFTTNGFSPFVIYAASANVASIGDGANQKVYPTLQAAIDAVQNNETITLLKDTNENVTLSKAIKFTLAGKEHLNGSIAAGSRYSMTTSETTSGNTEYTFTSVGGGSSSSISTPTTYAVNVNAATNGAVAADKKTASKGTTVTVTASPSKGYVVDAVKVVDKDGKDVAVTEKDGKYVFTMPGSAVTVTGTFKAETPVALPFTDVKSGDWFYPAVQYAYAQGLMTGTSATTFAPNGTMNRAMIVTVLYRLEKSPAVTGASKFTDVPAGQWYSDAVAWAAANKIVNGYDETTFGPMNAVTREQMAAILFRYEQVKGLENVTLEENLNRFPDQNKISAYAIPALQWAVGQKIINGNADGTLDPTGTATRAQVAQIFTNLLNK